MFARLPLDRAKKVKDIDAYLLEKAKAKAKAQPLIDVDVVEAEA